MCVILWLCVRTQRDSGGLQTFSSSQLESINPGLPAGQTTTSCWVICRADQNKNNSDSSLTSILGGFAVIIVLSSTIGDPMRTHTKTSSKHIHIYNLFSRSFPLSLSLSTSVCLPLCLSFSSSHTHIHSASTPAVSMATMYWNQVVREILPLPLSSSFLIPWLHDNIYSPLVLTIILYSGQKVIVIQIPWCRK